jgi:UDP-N-acetylglucosamine transferase subunit ALG13
VKKETRVTAEKPLRPLILVTVGGDHHPFDRLLGWLDRWLADGGAEHATVVVQHGPARPPRFGRPVDYLGYEELQQLIASADVVVSSGGPATLTEVRRAGLRPVAVPRRADLGEVVDDHQQIFVERLDALGLVVAVTEEDRLRAVLDAAVADPSWLRSHPADGEPRPAPAAVARVGGLIDDMLSPEPRGQVSTWSRAGWFRRRPDVDARPRVKG